MDGMGGAAGGEGAEMTPSDDDIDVVVAATARPSFLDVFHLLCVVFPKQGNEAIGVSRGTWEHETAWGLSSIIEQKHTKEEMTRLALACKYGSMQSLERLVRLGAETESLDEDGRTPLMWACGTNNPHIVTYLLREHNVDIHAKSLRGFTALMVASIVGASSIVSILLKESRYSIDFTNGEGKNALMLASAKGHIDIVRKLLDEKASIDDVCNDNKTALHLACHFARLEVVYELVSRHAKVSLTDPIVACVSELSVNEMAPFALDAEGFWRNRIECCRLLALNEANMEARKDGKTLLALARLTKNDTLIATIKAGTSFVLAKKQNYSEELALYYELENQQKPHLSQNRPSSTLSVLFMIKSSQ